MFNINVYDVDSMRSVANTISGELSKIDKIVEDWGNATDEMGRVPDAIVQINRDAIQWRTIWRREYAKVQMSIRFLKDILINNKSLSSDEFRVMNFTLNEMRNRAGILMVERNVIGDVLRKTAYRYV